MKKLTTYFFIFFLFGLTSDVIAQKKPAKIWASARFNKSTVMVGEPLVVTITVYTSTWFTEPPVFSEVQISGAIMVKLENRVGAKTVTIARKQYPAIEQKFVVYPKKIGKNTLSAFTVKTYCPPEGDYKSIERTITTAEKSFTVTPPPEGMYTSKWLSAYSLKLSETWDRPLENLKAGDVLERRINIRASGALAALIPTLDIEDIAFGSRYLKTPILGNIQNTNSFTGSRTEIITYLIEKPGNHTFPEVKMTWFNLNTKKIVSNLIEPINISVVDNPNLEFILSQQKALQEELAKEEEPIVVEKKPFEFMGLNWWQLLLAILAVVSIIKLIIRFIKKIKNQNEIKKKKQLASEGHYFELFQEAYKTKNTRSIIRQLFFWYDRFRKDDYTADFKDFVQKSEDKDFLDQVNTSEEKMYKDDNMDTLLNYNSAIADARNNLLNKKVTREKDTWSDLNPR